MLLEVFNIPDNVSSNMFNLFFNLFEKILIGSKWQKSNGKKMEKIDYFFLLYVLIKR